MPPNNTSTLLLVSAAAAAVTGSIALSLALTRIPPPIPRDVIPSPRTTLLPHLNDAQKKALGYPPDALPGARDISTPYGSMRVYEWGPIDGRKVLMVHGDATPAPLFSRIAEQLVARGCRVMTFDLWGRGYSDSPQNNQHNSRLYMQQIQYALTSSPLHWTGSTRFSIIGFSMGGAITMDFFAHQPSLVESVVLLGPAGLLHKLPPEYTRSAFRYPALVSASKMRKLLAETLGVELTTNDPVKALQVAREDTSTEGFTPAKACQFQFDHHQGHQGSFLSNIQYGPIQNQHQVWKKALDIVAGRVMEDTPLCGGKILVICGEDDDVVPATDVEEDLGGFLGEKGKFWEFETVPGNHGFPWPEGERVGRRIARFWGLEG